MRYSVRGLNASRSMRPCSVAGCGWWTRLRDGTCGGPHEGPLATARRYGITEDTARLWRVEATLAPGGAA